MLRRAALAAAPRAAGRDGRGGAARSAAARPPHQRLRGRADPRRARPPRAAARRARSARSRNQVVVAIFRSLDGESLEDFSIRLAQAWRIGQKGLDNGVIFLVFLDDRKMRIEVGYGLEGDADRRGLVVHSPRRRRPALPRGQDRRRHRARASTPSRPRSRARTRRPRRAAPASARSGSARVSSARCFVVLVLVIDPVAATRYRARTRARRGWTGERHGLGRARSSAAAGSAAASGGRQGRRIQRRRRQLRRRRSERELVMARHPRWVRDC